MAFRGRQRGRRCVAGNSWVGSGVHGGEDGEGLTLHSECTWLCGRRRALGAELERLPGVLYMDVEIANRKPYKIDTMS